MSSIATDDGLKLHVREWPLPAAAAPESARGVVQLVHGLGEHIGRYNTLAQALNAAGWSVFGHDQRGHGRSEGPRGTLPQEDTLLADLALVMDAKRKPGRHVLLGHSMGGLVAGRFVAESLAQQPAAWSRRIDALVLSSPAFDAGLGGGQKILLALAGALMPNIRLGNGLKPEWVSRDGGVVAAYRGDPLNHDRVTPRLARFIVDGGEVVRAKAAQWTVPTLLMWAGADKCVAPAGSAAFAAAAPADVVTSREWKPLFHEIFNEPEKPQVIAALTAWLARLP